MFTLAYLATTTLMMLIFKDVCMCDDWNNINSLLPLSSSLKSVELKIYLEFLLIKHQKSEFFFINFIHIVTQFLLSLEIISRNVKRDDRNSFFISFLYLILLFMSHYIYIAYRHHHPKHKSSRVSESLNTAVSSSSFGTDS